MQSRSRTSFAVVLLALATTASVANAQATRTWVSGVGDDANPCSRTAPCKTFAGAISKTANGGEISALDPGGFGAVTITKSITINGDGTLAGILAAGTTGVIVNATASDRVILRNLSINGAGTGISGIRFLAGGFLLVDKVTISGFTTFGIDVNKTAAGTIAVQDTTITNGGVTNNSTGIRLTSTVQFLALLNNVRLKGLNNGLDVGANCRATVGNSVISGNASNGILVSNGTGVANVNNSQISFNALVGANASVNLATIRLSNNEIYNNTSSITIAAGGVVSSAANNKVAGNGGGAAPNGPAIVIQ